MKKRMLYCITIIVFAVGVSILYYYYPRKVYFELAKEMDKPYSDFDRTYYIGFDYVDSEKMLIYWLVEHYKTFYPPSKQKQDYDSNFVENLAKELDFEKYDYLIAYQKRLKGLRHSPYLTKTEDGLYFDKRTPLIPTWDSVQTDKVYIYRIKKNSKYRSFGP